MYTQTKIVHIERHFVRKNKVVVVIQSELLMAYEDEYHLQMKTSLRIIVLILFE